MPVERSAPSAGDKLRTGMRREGKLVSSSRCNGISRASAGPCGGAGSDLHRGGSVNMCAEHREANAAEINNKPETPDNPDYYYC